MELISKKKPLLVYAPAKINLHLEVMGFREDGFHELAMVMQSINILDKLTFRSRDDGQIKLETDSSNLSGGEDNLIIKAAKVIQRDSRNKHFGADIKLSKNIPIGAGLAGGSTDAAATLFGLNILWDLGYSNKKLELLSSEIGSDIPFFISGGTQLCFGRGEILEKIETSNCSFGVILLKDPSISVSTPWAYSMSKKNNQHLYLKTEQAYEERRNRLRSSEWLIKENKSLPPLNNDLERVVAPLNESVREALKLLIKVEVYQNIFT